MTEAKEHSAVAFESRDISDVGERVIEIIKSVMRGFLEEVFGR